MTTLIISILVILSVAGKTEDTQVAQVAQVAPTIKVSQVAQVSQVATKSAQASHAEAYEQAKMSIIATEGKHASTMKWNDVMAINQAQYNVIKTVIVSDFGQACYDKLEKGYFTEYRINTGLRPLDYRAVNMFCN